MYHRTVVQSKKYTQIFPSYVCHRCRGETQPIDSQLDTDVTVDRTKLGAVPTFCYLGDMLSAGGGCDWTFRTRCNSTWNKLKSFYLFLIQITCLSRPVAVSSQLASDLSYSRRVRYGCQPALICRGFDEVTEAWCSGYPESSLWITPLAALHKREGVSEVSAVLRVGHLPCFGHLQRAKNTDPNSGSVPGIYSVSVSSWGECRSRQAWKDMRKVNDGWYESLEFEEWR